jgi:hypothetical protein
VSLSKGNPEPLRDVAGPTQLSGSGPSAPTSTGGLRPLVVLLLLGAVVFCAPPSAAKKKQVTSKTVSGQVLDPKDNGLDGATVALKDLQTGKTIEVFTQDGGHYQFSDLRFDHDYELRANYKGAKSETRQVSSFDTRARIVINFIFPPPSS